MILLFLQKWYKNWLATVYSIDRAIRLLGRGLDAPSCHRAKSLSRHNRKVALIDIIGRRKHTVLMMSRQLAFKTTFLKRVWWNLPNGNPFVLQRPRLLVEFRYQKRTIFPMIFWWEVNQRINPWNFVGVNFLFHWHGFGSSLILFVWQSRSTQFVLGMSASLEWNPSHRNCNRVDVWISKSYKFSSSYPESNKADLMAHQEWFKNWLTIPRRR